MAKMEGLKSSHHRPAATHTRRVAVGSIADAVIDISCEWGTPVIVVGFGDAGVAMADCVALNLGSLEPSILHALVLMQAPYLGALFSSSKKISSFFPEQALLLHPDHRRVICQDDPYPSASVKTISLAFSPPTLDHTIGLLKPIAQQYEQQKGEITDGFCSPKDCIIPYSPFIHISDVSVLSPVQGPDDTLLALLSAIELVL